jgi:DNA-binding MarR family transcriptional regulator
MPSSPKPCSRSWSTIRGADRRVIDELVARGWVRPGERDRLELTPAGAGAHAGLLERIQATRQLLVRGVTQEEYLAAIDILRRMAENLERPGA